MNNNNNGSVDRRGFLRDGLRAAALLGMGGALGLAAREATSEEYVWQIDPRKCLHCDRCATECVVQPSAVKCVHAYASCGYCRLCTGFFEPSPNGLNSGAENQLCPTAAILRTYIEDPYYEYRIDEALCIGCAKCVEGCSQFGNGSLYLQVRHDQCVNCNECAIAVVCPGEAFQRIPARVGYLEKFT